MTSVTSLPYIPLKKSARRWPRGGCGRQQQQQQQGRPVNNLSGAQLRNTVLTIETRGGELQQHLPSLEPTFW